MRSLILGGARSGKSALAERLATQSGLEVIYIATAEAGDAEMQARIEQHRMRRPAHWRTVECRRELAATLLHEAAPTRCLLVDCLTLWLSNLLCDADAAALDTEQHALLQALPDLRGRLILVSNEVGQGVVPMGELSRRFVDTAGRLHQALAAQCEQVLWVAAGLPLALKGDRP
ncbi:MAG: bifunctional adenosylcobinamide kinase/adenosylcobinamide-phosphate guanylyltransferase [Aquimonas sp.]|nr:bifunctional adenosylcobinamide kinase/adenosylcobinamide-phosphate guanylyltransferase [Aquimonas sp.]